MAVSTYYYKDNPVRSYRSFLCDTINDIEDLPTKTKGTIDCPKGTATGSQAFVIEDGSLWILNNQNIWTKI